MVRWFWIKIGNGRTRVKPNPSLSGGAAATFAGGWPDQLRAKAFSIFPPKPSCLPTTPWGEIWLDARLPLFVFWRGTCNRRVKHGRPCQECSTLLCPLLALHFPPWAGYPEPCEPQPKRAAPVPATPPSDPILGTRVQT